MTVEQSAAGQGLRKRRRSLFRALALRWWRRLCRKHNAKSGEFVRFPHERLWQGYGLERLKVRKRSFS